MQTGLVVELQAILEFIKNPAIRIFIPKGRFAPTQKLERVELLPVADILFLEYLVINNPLNLFLGSIPDLIAVLVLIDLSVRDLQETGDVLPYLSS